MRGFWLVLLSVIAVTPANADWLANAWPADAIPKNGNPAITFSATGTITLVSPQAALGEAQASGLSVERAVSACLGRYAPKTCAKLRDMTGPHTNLGVDRLIERAVTFDNSDGSAQEAAATALNRALKSL